MTGVNGRQRSLSVNTKPANTTRFLIHCLGRIALSRISATGFLTVICPATVSREDSINDEDNLLSRAVDALDEDTFDVGGFRRSGAPQHVGIVAQRRHGVV